MNLSSYVGSIPFTDLGENLQLLVTKNYSSFKDVPVDVLSGALVETMNLYSKFFRSNVGFGLRNLAKSIARQIPYDVEVVSVGRSKVFVDNVFQI